MPINNGNESEDSSTEELNPQELRQIASSAIQAMAADAKRIASRKQTNPQGRDPLGRSPEEIAQQAQEWQFEIDGDPIGTELDLEIFNEEVSEKLLLATRGAIPSGKRLELIAKVLSDAKRRLEEIKEHYASQRELQKSDLKEPAKHEWD
jgi:hypothetical protein